MAKRDDEQYYSSRDTLSRNERAREDAQFLSHRLVSLLLGDVRDTRSQKRARTRAPAAFHIMGHETTSPVSRMERRESFV